MYREAEDQISSLEIVEQVSRSSIGDLDSRRACPGLQ